MIYNYPLSIYTIILLCLVIIEWNLLFGFKIKYLVLETIAALLLYIPVLFVFAGIIHPFFKMFCGDDIGLQVFLDNIPNYLLLYLIITIIKDKFTGE